METRPFVVMSGALVLAFSGCLEIEPRRNPETDDCRTDGCDAGTECLYCTAIDEWICIEDIGLCPEPADCRSWGCDDGTECVYCGGLDAWQCLEDVSECEATAIPACDEYSYHDCPDGCVALCVSSCDACDDCNGPGGCLYPSGTDCRSTGCTEGQECLHCTSVDEWMCIEDIGLCPEPISCPDPESPTVSYVEGSREDPELCHVVDLECGESGEMFSNRCGCGCVYHYPSLPGGGYD